MRNTHFISYILLVLVACTPMANIPTSAATLADLSQSIKTGTPIALTPTSAPIPTFTPVFIQPSSSVKDEIKAFMVDYVVKNKIEPTIDIINKEKPPLIEKPPAQFIIISSPISGNIGTDYSKLTKALDTKNAEQVWIYENGNLTTPTNTQTAINDYFQKYIKNAPTMPSIFMWGYDEFGVVSISNDGQNVEVYLMETCGSACGSGVLLILEKNKESHKWEIKDTKYLWGS